MPEPLRLRLLGDLSLERTGQRLGEARRKPLAVLAYCWMEAPREVNRETVAGILWPESAPDRARHALTQTLYALRREVGVDLVRGTSQLSLADGQLSCDAADFVAAAAAKDYAKARALYVGPFLDGVAYAGAAEFDQWTDRIRTRLALVHRGLLLDEAAELQRAGHAVHSAQVLREASSWYPDDQEITSRWQLATIATSLVACAEQQPVTPTAPSTTWSDAEARAATSSRVAATGARGRRLAVAAICGASLALLGWSASQEPTALPTKAPATLAELWRRQRDARIAERRRQIDSTHMGRVLILPAKNLSGWAGADSSIRLVAWTLHTIQQQSFAQAVPENVTSRLLSEAAATKMPTSSTWQLASVMRRTGAALAIQPLFLRAGADSIRLTFVFYRDIAHTTAARRGQSNLESLSGPDIAAVAPSANVAVSIARPKLHAFIRSLEQCAPLMHQAAATAPWCWSAGRQLQVVDVDRRFVGAQRQPFHSSPATLPVISSTPRRATQTSLPLAPSPPS